MCEKAKYEAALEQRNGALKELKTQEAQLISQINAGNQQLNDLRALEQRITGAITQLNELLDAETEGPKGPTAVAKPEPTTDGKKEKA